MLASFIVVAHDYFITKQSVDDLYIHVRREMRLTPFLGMKQPAPPNSIMGMDVVMMLKHKGKAAIGYKWRLFKDHQIIQEGITDHNGMSVGINIEFSNGVCGCHPQWFRENSPFNEMRFCDEFLPAYQIEIDEPETVETAAEASPWLSVPLESQDAASEPHVS